MILAGYLLTVLLFGASMAQPDPEELRKTGQALYGSLCQRCHGETGDATGYPEITPLSGITLRIPGQEIAGLSAPFVGRSFEGKDAQALVAYLDTLKGEKGFERPGYLFSPDLLEKKLAETREYRVIDARPQGEYLAGHIPNAVAWPGGDSSAETLDRLASLGAGPRTFIVVYDALGGPPAAAVWWAVRSSGHERVAVLDGGFESWTSHAHPVTANPTSFAPLPSYPQPGGTLPAGAPESCEAFSQKQLVLGEAAGTQGPRFDWRKTRNETGLLPASQVRAYLDDCGITKSGRHSLIGDSADRAYLLFLLHLLGSSPHFSPDGNVLCLAEQ